MTATAQPFISSLRFRGANLAAITAVGQHELVLCSPADTGKTFALCYKTTVVCMQKKGVHAALVRNTHKSLKDSVVKTMNRVTDDLGVRLMGGDNPTGYRFPNGSEVVLVGMDKPDKLLSSEWDIIQVCQAEELKEAQWEIAASRVTGRGAVVKHPCIYGDCNPSNAKHWIRFRKSLKLVTGSTKDNPELYHDDGTITEAGVKRLALAEALYTGVRRMRLLNGIWATAEGVVYDQWVPETHAVHWDESEFKTFILTVDEGYTNPAVVLLVGIDADDRWHVCREFYKTNQLERVVVEQVCRWSAEKGGINCAVDLAAAGLIAAIRKGIPELGLKGVNAVGAKGHVEGGDGKHIVLGGIQQVQQRLAVAGDGRPRLTVEPSCVETINEFESYVWKPEKDEPVKEHDHAMDAIRYAVCLKGLGTGAFSGASGMSSNMRVEGGLDPDTVDFTVGSIDF